MIVWTDVETTGLDPDSGMLLEVALLATTDYLMPIDVGVNVVLAVDADRAQSLMSDTVVTMHERSGLLDAMRTAKRDLAEATALCVEYLEQWDTSFTPLAGSNVKFDRRWLEVHMPDVVDRLHYRDICVSSTKETCRRFFPDAAASKPQKAFTHRAMDDLRESIEEYRHYLEALGSPVLAAA